MPHKPFMGRTRSRLARGALCLLLALSLSAARPARADEADFRRGTDYLWFLLGAVAGFAAHETGHLITDYAFGMEPSLNTVKLGPIPFFAIQPNKNLTRFNQYTVASMGFFVQNVYSELILHIDPKLREHTRPLLKGMLAFHVALSLGYAITGFAGAGPRQSDVNTMSRALGVGPWAIGLMLLAPAAIDTYRYFVPDSVWAPWVSLAAKATMLGALFTF